MEPISTALAGIALFKSAVDGIKGAIGTANDVGEIAGFIDKLFEGEKQVQQRRNQQSGVSVGDQFGVTNVAREVIDAKLAQEQMREIASMVDMRFGHGTWRSIVDERAKRIREAKEAAAEARRKKRQEERERAENMKQVLMISGALFVAVLFFLGMIYMIMKSS